MGYSDYKAESFTRRVSAKIDRGEEVFEHTAAIKSGKVRAGVHEKLDPKKANKAGKIIRESFDSAEHPDSKAVAVGFDVTGSMHTVPRVFVSKLDKLMMSLVKKGYMAHPHVLFGAIGDATTDTSPLQVGQFESGNEMDEALSLIHLEGGGGGQNTESYELFMYYMARHTEMDCYTKRGQKGYLFISGDEIPYAMVKRSEVEAFIGDILQEDIPLETILAELREKFEVHWVMPGGTNHWNDQIVIDRLKTLFVQNFHRMENPNDIVEMICSIIGVGEGYDLHDVAAGLKDIGADGKAVDRVSKALVPYASTRTVAKVATATGALVESGGDAITKL